MTRVIHTGDTHLGYRQYHRPERKRDFVDAFQQVAEDAVTDDVDAVVHAGDLFHDRRPNLEDIMGALSVLRTLDDADVPFLAIVGNHEGKRESQWLDLFESLGLATRLGEDPITIGETAFYGLDFVPRSQRDDLDLSFADHDREHAALVTHGLFEPFDFGEWDAREIMEAAAVDFDALLLGDNHDPETAEVDGTWLTYCGSTERASAAEREDRGYNLVSFDGEVDVRRRGLDTREFAFVDVELGDGEGVERVRERLDEYDLDGSVAIVTIDGDGEPVTPATVEEYATERGAIVARVTDHREVPEEDDREISFADPDDAVRERVRELGLSPAARGIDETVRASKIADSNVADEVEEQVSELVETGDASEFAAVEPETAADGDSTADDAANPDGVETATADELLETDEESDGEAPDATGPGETEDSAETEDGAETEDRTATEDGGEAESTAATDDTGDAENQGTIGEFL